MVGLRTYTTLDPNQWRFPQWKSNVYYPSGSFVGTVEYQKDDSEQPLWTFWVATLDVKSITDSDRNISNSPSDSDSDWIASDYAFKPWAKVFDSTASNLESRLDALLPLFELLGVDSDIRVLYSRDSDFRVKDSEQDSDIQMEVHDRKGADSDIRVDIDSDLTRAIHDSRAADSDIYEFIKLRDSENDSDHRMEIHDRKHADSDIYEFIKSKDSDNDSDLRMEIHDRRASDSDIYEFIKLRDSENDSDYRMEVHDRKAADSDIYEFVKLRDSENDSDHRMEIHDRKAADSDIYEFVKSKDSDNDSDHRMEIHDRKAADSDIYEFIKSKDSDNDSDHRMEIHDRKAADSDIYEFVKLRDSDHDSDIAQAFHDFKADDSDIRVVIKDNDSEIRRMLDSEIHDRKSVDSEIRITIANLDSENKRMHDSDRHDWKADDSDLRVRDSELDSDIQMEVHDRKGADSDIRVDIDSEVLLLHIRDDSDSDRLTNYMKRREDRDSDFMTMFRDIDSDIINLKINADDLDVPTGFPVGSIQAFVSTDLPVGFQLADGREFNPLAYPDLFNLLGTNRLPDLRNQFLRSWNNDSDGYGNSRAMLSQQNDELRSHDHATNAMRTGGGIQYSSGPFSLGNAQIFATGGDETRPTNVMVAYGIAMYQGAGVIYDSDIIESVIRVRMADYDSDIDALYKRVDYHTFFIQPDSEDLPFGYQHDVGIPTEIFGDVTVSLNGVGVTQWSLSNDVFTFNFVTRANLDRIDVKMRR